MGSLILSSLCVLSAFLLVPDLSAAESLPKKIRIGVLTSLIGPAGVNGTSIRDGAFLAKGELERSGWSVDLKVEDDASQSSKTLSALRLLQSQGYSLFVGLTWSYLAEAAAPVIIRSKSVVISPANSSESAGGIYDGIFYLTPKSSLKAGRAAEWIRNSGVMRPVVLTPMGSWGEVHREVYLGALKALQISPLLDERYGYGEEDVVVRGVVSKLRKLGVDGILTTNTPEGEAILQRRLTEQKLSIPILTTENVFEAVALGLMKSEELSSPTHAFLRELSPDFVELYEKRYGRKPLMYADTGYDAVMILAEAVSKVGSEPEKIKEYLRSSLNHTGVSGSISFDKNGDVKTADYILRRVGEPIGGR